MARRRFNPDGNERLTAAVGLILLAGTALELLTLLLGLQNFLPLHVFVGYVLLPPIALKLASTGWRFLRYYTRNTHYRLKGAPQTMMRLLAPLLVAFTALVFGSGVAMGLLHGHALDVARRVHGPAAFGFTVLVAAHVLVYLRRALRSTAADVAPATRSESKGAWGRTALVAAAIAGGVVVGVATLPTQHVSLHLPSRHDGGGG
jgi:purine-cytosine permease-like protein